MNKARRHELKMLKYKKRLKLYRAVTKDIKSNFYALRSHSTPCSCDMCRGEKYNRAKAKREVQCDYDIVVPVTFKTFVAQVQIVSITKLEPLPPELQAVLNKTSARLFSKMPTSLQ